MKVRVTSRQKDGSLTYRDFRTLRIAYAFMRGEERQGRQASVTAILEGEGPIREERAIAIERGGNTHRQVLRWVRDGAAS